MIIFKDFWEKWREEKEQETFVKGSVGVSRGGCWDIVPSAEGEIRLSLKDELVGVPTPTPTLSLFWEFCEGSSVLNDDDNDNDVGEGDEA